MDASNFDIESFQEEVFDHIDHLERPAQKLHGGVIAAVAVGSGAAAAGGFIKTALTLLPIGLLVWFVEARRSRGERQTFRPARKRTDTPRKTAKEKPADVLHARQQAESLLKEARIRQLLCPALRAGVNDTYDIAKRITPILLPLAMAGTLTFPVNPLFYAMLALLIARMGVASLCRGLESKENLS